ncbi:RNA polymerase sigma factor [Streptomyces yangpuensis]|uniref:RNA polymerase sigma factor n=1 Tax=Streptomyces yangpuensis TaxID=1648182 RepID=UPI0037FD6C7C
MDVPGADDGLEGFDDFYTNEFRPLVRFVMRYGATFQEATDAVQEAFIEAARKWPSISNRRAWMRRVAYLKFLRCVQVRELSVGEPPDTPGPLSPDARWEVDEQTEFVRACFAKLPYAQRRAMSYHYDGFSHSEIATELGTSVEAVRQNVSRARKKLAELLEEVRNEEKEADDD